MDKTQKGFTVVEGLLILVVVGILGFTGWYVWHVTQTANNSFDAANQARNSQLAYLNKKVTNSNTSATLNQTPPTSPTTTTCNQTLYVTSTDGLNLRKDKSASSEKLAAMPWGIKVTGGCDDGTWSQVTYSGKTGYSLSQYLSTTNRTIFKIKEFGVEFRLTSKIADLEYVVRQIDSNTSYAYFSSQSLAKLDNNCSDDKGPVGGLGQLAGNSVQPGYTTQTPKINGHYYLLVYNLYSCGANTSGLQATQTTAFQAAINSSLKASQ